MTGKCPAHESLVIDRSRAIRIHSIHNRFQLEASKIWPQSHQHGPQFITSDEAITI
jgi:hypothetical protein